MNSDMLTEIFEYCEERVELREICKEWSELITPLVWVCHTSNIDKSLIRKLKITNLDILDDEFKELIKQYPNIESLNCCYCHDLTDEAISSLVVTLPCLKEFRCAFSRH